MKREILFKYYIKNKHTGVIYTKIYSLNQIEENGLKDLFDIENYTIVAKCQFTGLLDKNGNKIFEGDNDQNYEVVKWCDKRNGYSIWTYDHPTKDFIHCNCYSCEGHYEIADVINEIEITGNIHDK